jgi:hypothetical protein
MGISVEIRDWERGRRGEREKRRGFSRMGLCWRDGDQGNVATGQAAMLFLYLIKNKFTVICEIVETN